MCTFLLQIGALWGVCLMHCEICAVGLLEGNVSNVIHSQHCDCWWPTAIGLRGYLYIQRWPSLRILPNLILQWSVSLYKLWCFVDNIFSILVPYLDLNLWLNRYQIKLKCAFMSVNQLRVVYCVVWRHRPHKTFSMLFLYETSSIFLSLKWIHVALYMIRDT